MDQFMNESQLHLFSLQAVLSVPKSTIIWNDGTMNLRLFPLSIDTLTDTCFLTFVVIFFWRVESEFRATSKAEADNRIVYFRATQLIDFLGFVSWLLLISPRRSERIKILLPGSLFFFLLSWREEHRNTSVLAMALLSGMRRASQFIFVSSANHSIRRAMSATTTNFETLKVSWFT